MIRALRHLYRLLLRLFPSDFRQEFASEMEGVFAELGIWMPDTAIWLLWLLASLAALSLLARRDPAAGLLAVLPIAPIFLAHVGGSRRDGPFFWAWPC